MLIKSAIAKLAKAQWTVNEISNGRYIASKAGIRDEIEFSRNGAESQELTCLRVLSPNDHDHFNSDYCGGVWADSIAQALRLAK